jgi:hypothetical protein
MLMGITIYTMTLGILMWLLLYMVPLKILQVVFQALTLFQSVHALQTVILEHFNTQY